MTVALASLLTSKQLPAEPFVTGYWKGKFEGVVDSETDLAKQFEQAAKVVANGRLVRRIILRKI